MSERKNFEFFTLGEEESVKHAPNKAPGVLDSSFFLRESRRVAALNGPRYIHRWYMHSACTHIPRRGFKWALKPMGARVQTSRSGRTGLFSVTMGHNVWNNERELCPVIICNLDFIIARWLHSHRMRNGHGLSRFRNVRESIIFLYPMARIANLFITSLNVQTDDAVGSFNS